MYQFIKLPQFNPGLSQEMFCKTLPEKCHSSTENSSEKRLIPKSNAIEMHEMGNYLQFPVQYASEKKNKRQDNKHVYIRVGVETAKDKMMESLLQFNSC